MRIESVREGIFHIILEAGEEIEVRWEDHMPLVVEHGDINAPDAECKALAEVVIIKEDK